ncbi:hypothetical protein AB0910_21245 [Streptomyces sp. NPDC047002]|uniref:hypothetical protein n=1 Tax=Streptomyces sp. NPDC047002 TaxID=3155475 RepID=UPI00345528F1
MPKHRSTLALGTLAALLAVSACDVSAKDVGDASLRTLVAKLGAGMFKSEHHPVKGGLTCKAAKGHAYGVSCTGSDTSGRPLRLTVEADRRQSVSPGGDERVTAEHIVGTADGKVVFRSTCLGSAC